MPKHTALALAVVIVIAFAYWFGRHTADRSTMQIANDAATSPTAATQPPAAPVSPPPAPAAAAPARKGMSWGVVAERETPDGVVLIGCRGEPATDSGSCDAVLGDTECTRKLPLLCLKLDDTPAPEGLYAPAEDGVSSDDFHAAWLGATVATTAPMAGTALGSRAEADRACAKAFGEGWRLASARDGRRGETPAGATGPAGTPAPSGAFYAAGDPIRTARFWIANDAQPANCWD